MYKKGGGKINLKILKKIYIYIYYNNFLSDNKIYDNIYIKYCFIFNRYILIKKN